MQQGVSIHAPAGGATRDYKFTSFTHKFQSTPLREGRRWMTSAPYSWAICFNPRPCGRGDVKILVLGYEIDVSIHAPAGGATLRRWWVRSTSPCFNPRPCGRGDGNSPEGAGTIGSFQSTPLREGRPRKARARNKPMMFQSTPLREGRPPAWSFDSLPTSCFNPRPCGRGDMLPGIGIGFVLQFQSTPLREGRPGGLTPDAGTLAGFNPRPCGRGD